MLLEIAIGDAYGAGFEFAAREKIRQANTLAAFVPHELGGKAGRFTDDTQMSVAVAEVLLSGVAWSGDVFADAFVRCYQRDPRMGYAKGLQGLLDACADGKALRQKIRPDSRRNGAAMRAVPLGLIADKQLLASVAKEQAAVTHNTPEGILSSQVVASMAHLLLYEQVAVVDLAQRINQLTGFALRADWTDEVECDAIQTLHAVHTALLANRSMANLLRNCVEFGGDVDSVAAIAMGLASLTPEYAQDVPATLCDTLEDGAYGRQFLLGLDVALAEKFPILQRHS